MSASATDGGYNYFDHSYFKTATLSGILFRPVVLCTAFVNATRTTDALRNTHAKWGQILGIWDEKKLKASDCIRDNEFRA